MNAKETNKTHFHGNANRTIGHKERMNMLESEKKTTSNSLNETERSIHNSKRINNLTGNNYTNDYSEDYLKQKNVSNTPRAVNEIDNSGARVFTRGNTTSNLLNETERNILNTRRKNNLTSNNDIDNHSEEYLKLKHVSDTPRVIENVGGSGVRILTRGIYNYATDNNVRKTTDDIRDIASVTAVPAIDVVMSGLSRSLRAEYAAKSKLCTINESDIQRTRAILEKLSDKPMYNSFITEQDLEKVNTFLRSHGDEEVIAYKMTGNKKDFIRLERELFSELKKENLLDAGGSAFSSHNVSKGKLIKLLNDGKLTHRQQQLVEEFLKVGKANQLNPKAHRRARRLLFKRIRRYLSDSDAGKGLAFILSNIMKGRILIKTSYRTLCNLYSSLHLMNKMSVLLMRRTFVENLRKKIAKELEGTPAGAIIDKVRKGKKPKGKEDISKKQTRLGKAKEKMKAHINKLKDKFEKTTLGKVTVGVRHPWKAFRNSRAYKKMANTKVGKAFNKVSTAIRKIFKPFGSVLSGIMTVLTPIKVAIGAVLGIFLIFVIVILMGFALFDFGSQEEEYRIAALEQIQSSYKAELEKINGLRNSNEYYLVTGPEYIDHRNEEIYAEYMPENLVESTNAAEILSMAVVNFDFDLESAGKKEVKEYIRKLYNGSHRFTLKVTPEQYQTVDANGKVIIKERKKAHVVIETHYFDSLFNCQLSNIAATLTEGSEVIITDQRSQMWTSTGYDYWLDNHKPMIWSKGTNQRRVADEWKEKGSVFTNGIATIDGRALVAVSQALGNPGDYIDAYFEDGSVLPCIVADAKSTADPNITEFGHVSGGQLSVLEFEVQYDKYWEHRPTAYNPGSGPAGNRWEPFADSGLRLRNDSFVANRVVKIVNGGPNPPEEKNQTGDKIAKYAKEQVGKPVTPNGATPEDGFDAPGLVYYCYGKVDKTIPRIASEQIKQGTKVSNPRPGDIVVEGGSVGIYIGNKQMIHAPKVASSVSIKNVGKNASYVRF